MTMHYYDRNLNNINKLADNTKAAAKKFLDYCEKNKIGILIYETIRTTEQQRQYVQQKKSQTMRSYHLVGQALDFVPTNGYSGADTLWNGYGKSEIKKAINYAKSIGFEWGGDWKGFVDKPHLQYNYKGYGTDTFGKGASPAKSSGSKKTTSSTSSGGNSKIKEFQKWLNVHYNAGLTVDGYNGPKTKRAAIKAYQTELNRQFKAGLTADGYWGPKTKAATRTVAKGARGNITRILQGMLYCLGIDPKGFDGIFGNGCAAAVKVLQGRNGLAQDAKSGKNTFAALFA